MADCDDAACRQQVVEAMWARGPRATADALAELPRPEEGIAAINRLAELHPGRLDAICPLLTPGPSRFRCDNISQRPHLGRRDEVLPTWTPRPGGGPARTYLAPPREVLRAPPTAIPVPACEGHADPIGCVTEAALSAARAGDHAAAAGICAGLDPGMWRDECMFTAGSAAGFLGGDGGYETALPLCLSSGSFAGNCLAHASLLAARGVPDATSTDPAGWRALAGVAEGIESAWSTLEPDFAAIVVDRFWSDALALAYSETPQPTGAPMAFLPEVAHPHVRAALALRLVVLGPRRGRSLEQWVAAAEAALVAQPTVAHARTGEGVTLVAPAWPADLPGEEQRPAIHFAGTARRTVASDPRDDLTICLLEAFARRDPAPDDLVREGLQSAAEPVRWTAERLLEHRNQRPGPAQ